MSRDIRGCRCTASTSSESGNSASKSDKRDACPHPDGSIQVGIGQVETLVPTRTDLFKSESDKRDACPHPAFQLRIPPFSIPLFPISLLRLPFPFLHDLIKVPDKISAVRVIVLFRECDRLFG